MDKTKLRGVIAGTGALSQLHFDAWQRTNQIEITALSFAHKNKALEACKTCNIPRYYTDTLEMIESEKPDFIDIINPPETFLEIYELAAFHKTHIMCRKPLASDIEDTKEIVGLADDDGIRLMIHNYTKFQPWYREIKKILNKGTIGNLHYLNFRSRLGNGHAESANEGPLINFFKSFAHEAGIPFIDVFRYLGGEIEWVNAYHNRLRPGQNLEDITLINFEFQNRALGVLDINRFNEPTNENHNYTGGEFLLEGTTGFIKLGYDASISVKQHGKPVQQHHYQFNDPAIFGDSIYLAQQHFINCLIEDVPFETSGKDYLKNLAIEEAIYHAANTGIPQNIPHLSYAF